MPFSMFVNSQSTCPSFSKVLFCFSLLCVRLSLLLLQRNFEWLPQRKRTNSIVDYCLSAHFSLNYISQKWFKISFALKNDSESKMMEVKVVKLEKKFTLLPNMENFCFGVPVSARTRSHVHSHSNMKRFDKSKQLSSIWISMHETRARCRSNYKVHFVCELFICLYFNNQRPKKLFSSDKCMRCINAPKRMVANQMKTSWMCCIEFQLTMSVRRKMVLSIKGKCATSHSIWCEPISHKSQKHKTIFFRHTKVN